ncbi:MAG TPA: CotH kinase family protein [Verrucomicrobiae bacterium]
MANSGAAPERQARRWIRVLLVCSVAALIGITLLISAAINWAKSTTHGNWQLERRPMVLAKADFPPPFEMPASFETNAILAPKNAKRGPGDDIFVDCVIPKIEITVEGDEMKKLRANERSYVLCTITEGEKKFTNVAIRLKGGPGSFRPVHDQPSFTVNFDKNVEDQTFHGLKKIHLNSSVQDRSLLEEKISRELFNAAGVPTPRAGHAVVTFNKRLMGVYVLVEGINKQFLKRHYKDPDGNVFDGKSGNDVYTRMRVNSGDNRKDRARLDALAGAIRDPDVEQRLQKLDATLDIDRFLSFVALEMILWHWDGYTVGRNNFRIFHDKATDRMVFFPQGMDQTFNEAGRSVMPENPNGAVVRAVMEIPELRSRYRSRVAEIATNVFKADAISSRIYEVSVKVQEALAEIDGEAAKQHASMANSLRRRVRNRADYLERFLNPAKPVQFDGTGVAALKNWRPVRDLGEADLTQLREEGNTLLRVATEKGCTASWRNTARLQPGKYRLEARIKTRGVVFDSTDPRAGAGLRVSGHREGQKNAGDSDWKSIAFDFEVTPEKPDVELVCELRANAGEILYDASSIQLKRL